MSNSNSIRVEIRAFPGSTSTVTVPKNSTWGDVLRAANLTASQYSGRVSGVVLTEDTVLDSDTSVLVTTQSKSAAGDIVVELRAFPGSTNSVTVPAGSTWADVLTKANLSPTGVSGRVSGVVLQQDSVLMESTQVLVTASSKSA